MYRQMRARAADATSVSETTAGLESAARRRTQRRLSAFWFIVDFEELRRVICFYGEDAFTAAAQKKEKASGSLMKVQWAQRTLNNHWT